MEFEENNYFYEIFSTKLFFKDCFQKLFYLASAKKQPGTTAKICGRIRA
jgi:hypothetical protein